MKHKKQFMVLVGMIISICFILTGCNTNPRIIASGSPQIHITGAQTFIFSSATSDEFEVFDGNAVVEISIGNNQYHPIGKIENGILSLELLETLDENVLVTGPIFFSETNPPGIRWINVMSFRVVEGRRIIGYMQYSYDIWGGNTAIEQSLNQMYFVYFSDNCIVEGQSQGEWNGIISNRAVEISGRKGWNMIFCYGELNEAGNTFHRTFTSNNSMAPEGMRWSIRPGN